MEMTISELTRLVDGVLDGVLDGAGEKEIRGVADIRSAAADEITFLSNAKYERYMSGTKAAAVIVSADYAGPKGENCALIRCKDAYFAFRQAMVAIYGFRSHHFDGIDSRASIDRTADLRDDVRVGAFSTIAGGCSVATGTVIYPGVQIGPNCKIGKGCTIYSNVTLYDGITIGDRVTIHAGSSIGQDGFGYAVHNGKHEKIPQAGSVVLEDDVEIGACCTIDRATMGATIIGAGTKMSNLVAVGHGTRMGKHCLLVAQVGIAGSVEVGSYCVFAGQAGIAGHIRIGDGVRVGAKSGVNGSIAAGQEVLGIPALPLAEARRAMMTFSRLPHMRTAIRKMTREIQELKQQMEEIKKSNHPGGSIGRGS